VPVKDPRSKRLGLRRQLGADRVGELVLCGWVVLGGGGADHRPSALGEGRGNEAMAQPRRLAFRVGWPVTMDPSTASSFLNAAGTMGA
jgi:hypothetical protein